MSISVNFPFALSTGSVGYLESSQTIADALRSNLCSLLLTNWGERLMHYDLGCNLRQFLFEQKTAATKLAIAERINTQVAKWMPFLSIALLNVRFSEDDPSVPDPGIGIRIEAIYGNIPVNLLVTFPNG